MRRRCTRTLAHVVATAFLAAGCNESPLPVDDLLPPPMVIDSPTDVVAALVRAYQQRDPDLLASLLANDTDHNAEYLFLLSEPSDTGETQWGYVEEARIHRRMFQPQNPAPGERPVPAEVWLQSLTINLTANEIFSERLDLYSQDGGADGKLDPALWRATDASYATDLFFDLAGDTDYTIDGTANFVVIENIQKDVGDAGKFLLYIWEDVGTISKSDRPAIRPKGWSAVKRLYR